jgi:hypothetical protein
MIMDWFNQLGIYASMLPSAQPLAMDLATTPGLDAERQGFMIGYHMNNAPETVQVYQSGLLGG